jgi:hypothetical protein
MIHLGQFTGVVDDDVPLTPEALLKLDTTDDSQVPAAAITQPTMADMLGQAVW